MPQNALQGWESGKKIARKEAGLVSSAGLGYLKELLFSPAPVSALGHLQRASSGGTAFGDEAGGDLMVSKQGDVCDFAARLRAQS